MVSEPLSRIVHTYTVKHDAMFTSPYGHFTLLLRFCQILQQGVGIYYLPGQWCSQNAHSLQAANAAHVQAAHVIFKVFNALTWHRQDLIWQQELPDEREQFRFFAVQAAAVVWLFTTLCLTRTLCWLGVMMLSLLINDHRKEVMHPAVAPCLVRCSLGPTVLYICKGCPD